MPLFEPVSLAPIVMFEVILHFRKRAFNRLDEIQTARSVRAAGHNGFTFEMIIGDDEHFAK